MSESYCRENYYRLLIQQGATLVQRFIWEDEDENPVDLTSYTARMQIRETVESTTVVLELTTTNGRITLGGTAGTVDLLVAATDTAGIDAGDYVYDLELESAGGTVTRLVEGDAVVTAEVTR